jgi:uncharacterized protein DUF6636
VHAAAPPGFVLPSRNIGCVYGGSLRCDIRSGLKPAPSARCELDWTGIYMERRGRPRPQCAGDTVLGSRLPVLHYGAAWHRKGVTCRSRRIGLRCTNAAGHGFELSRDRWRLF